VRLASAPGLALLVRSPFLVRAVRSCGTRCAFAVTFTFFPFYVRCSFHTCFITHRCRRVRSVLFVDSPLRVPRVCTARRTRQHAALPRYRTLARLPPRMHFHFRSTYALRSGFVLQHVLIMVAGSVGSVQFCSGSSDSIQFFVVRSQSGSAGLPGWRSVNPKTLLLSKHLLFLSAGEKKRSGRKNGGWRSGERRKAASERQRRRSLLAWRSLNKGLDGENLCWRAVLRCSAAAVLARAYQASNAAQEHLKQRQRYRAYASLLFNNWAMQVNLYEYTVVYIASCSHAEGGWVVLDMASFLT